MRIKLPFSCTLLRQSVLNTLAVKRSRRLIRSFRYTPSGTPSQTAAGAIETLGLPDPSVVMVRINDTSQLSFATTDGVDRHVAQTELHSKTPSC